MSSLARRIAMFNRAAGFSPRAVSSLAFYWETSQISSTDGTAVTPTDASGNAVSITGASGKKALYKTNIVGSNPALLFDGVDDYYTLGSFSCATLIIAAKYTSATFGAFPGLFTGPNAASTDDIYLIGNSSTNQLYPSGRAISIFLDNTAYANTAVTNAWHVFSFTDASPQTAASWLVGDERDAPGHGFWSGYIYGMAAYTTSLSAANRKLVEQYFARKVGVTIT